jgi:cytochrome c2
MGVSSRELLVGFLLGLALATNGCGAGGATVGSVPAVAAPAPTSTVETASNPAATETIGESEAVTDTATLSKSVSISTSQVISESMAQAPETPTDTTAISATAAVSPTAEVSSTASIRATEDATTAVISETAAMTASDVSSTTVANTSSEPAAPADPALVAAGLQAYHNLYCGVCHTLDAADTHGTFGPPHNGIGTIAATRLTDGSYHGAAKSPADYLRESIIDPQVFTAPGYVTTSHRMPNYSYLDSATIDALVAFLLQQK